MELKTQTFPESQFWFLETLTKPLLHLVLITIFTWIVTEIKCVRKHVMTCGVYRELYLLKSLVYYDYKMFLLFWSHGEKFILAFFQGFSFDHESRIYVQSIHGKCIWRETLSWECWRMGSSPAFPRAQHTAPASRLDFLAPGFLSCKTRDELDDLSPSHSIILNVRHKFAWIRESLKLGKFQKII